MPPQPPWRQPPTTPHDRTLIAGFMLRAQETAPGRNDTSAEMTQRDTQSYLFTDLSIVNQRAG
jgi:hypothetical protein